MIELGVFILCCTLSWAVYRYVEHRWPEKQ